MPINNNRVEMKKGETGFTITALFKDADNALIDLTPYTARIIIAPHRRYPGSAVTVTLDEPMVPHANQVTHKGEASFTFSEVQADLVDYGRYDIEMILEDGSGVVQKFPKREGLPFGYLDVLDTLV
jgi:hypothetical protein